MYLWRAVDAEGEVLELLVQSRRDKAAAQKLMRKLLKRYATVPDEWVTDRYAAYGAALRNLELTTPVHVSAKRMNNQAESSHVPVRRRESKLARLQNAGVGTALSQHARCHLQHLHYSPSPHLRPNAPALSSRGILSMA